jgi:S-adenosylmethionine:tRNA ribosyltransferase-isomerase
VTLHVGAGTFKPVKSETMDGHEMHAELIDVSIETIQLMADESHLIIVTVGTTSLRTIESLYWMGVKASKNIAASLDDLEVKQWDAYDLGFSGTVKDALNNLMDWMKRNGLKRIICKTQIIIAPPYNPKTARALITNFHQPDSTLLLLVAAVAGTKWRDIYEYALSQDFRFLSYGDSSLLFFK